MELVKCNKIPCLLPIWNGVIPSIKRTRIHDKINLSLSHTHTRMHMHPQLEQGIECLPYDYLRICANSPPGE